MSHRDLASGVLRLDRMRAWPYSTAVRMGGTAVVTALIACSGEQAPVLGTAALATDVESNRLALIRDTAAEMGVYNAALFAGIAISETHLAHCWSEATYACMGPASPSCNNAPIIAGSADGPCSDQQGGLGMFQFDAGTYAETLATYGDAILTVEGNTAQAVSFVIDRLSRDVPGVTDWMSAASYLNEVPLTAGDPTTEQWAKFVACRYNGCCASTPTCTSRANGYRDNAIATFEQYGAGFWTTANRCTALPDDGVIDQRSDCYIAGGDPRHWRREASGFAGGHEWTYTTTSATAANFARWLLPARGWHELEVYVDGGEATTAVYTIEHAGVIDRVVVDQTTAHGFISLGTFELAGDGTDHVELADNTGIAQQKLIVDALRVTLIESPPPTSDGCSASHGGSLGILLVIGCAIPLRRRAHLGRLNRAGDDARPAPRAFT